MKVLEKTPAAGTRSLLDATENMDPVKVLIKLNREIRTALYQCRIKEHSTSGSGTIRLDLSYLV